MWGRDPGDATTGESRLAKIASGEWSPRSWLGTLADAIAVVSAVALGWKLLSKDDVPQSVLAVFVCALALVSIAMVFRLHRQLSETAASYARRVAVSEAMPSFAEAAAGMRQATIAAIVNKDSHEYVRELRSALKRLAKGFSETTGVACRVAVKEIYVPGNGGNRPEDLAVRTICSSTPGPLKPRDEVDWVRDNTDFLDILANNRPYFLGQDLPTDAKKGRYQNSHWDGPTVATENFEYRAAIVWPIGAPISGEGDPNGERMAIVGFLCLDSLETGKFDPRIDIPTGQAFAAIAYPGLSLYIDGRKPKDDQAGEVDLRIESSGDAHGA